MIINSKLRALILTGILCAGLGAGSSAKTLQSYEFPKDYTEEEGITDNFKFKNGFHACIDKGKLTAISTFGMPVTFISPEFSVQGAKYFVFSFRSQMGKEDSTLKVTLKTLDSKAYDHELKLIDTSTNIYALQIPDEQKNLCGFEITPQVSADFSDMYAVELDFARLVDSKTFVSLKIGSSEIFDGSKMLPTDSSALIIDGRTLTPARCVAEALGANVEWDDSTKTVTITKESTTVKLTIGSNKAYINDKETTLDVPAQIINDRTYTPARFVAEALGYTVFWDDQSKTVVITDSDKEKAYTIDEARLLLESYIPKSELDKEALVSIDGYNISASVARYATVAANQYFAPDGNPNEETKKTISEEIEAFYSSLAATNNLAIQNNIVVTEEEFQSQILENINLFKDLYGEDLSQTIEQYTNLTPYAYFEMSMENIFYQKLFDVCYGPQGTAQNRADIQNKAIEQMKDTYVRAKHILISFPDDLEKDQNGNVLQQEKEPFLATANEILEKIAAGEDFDALIKEYNQDPGMLSYPDGYYFTKGQMVEPFEKASFELKVGEASGIVETFYGYHIIQRLPIAADNNGFFKCEVYTQLAENAFDALLNDISKDYKFNYSDNYQSRADEFLS